MASVLQGPGVAGPLLEMGDREGLSEGTSTRVKGVRQGLRQMTDVSNKWWGFLVRWAEL